MDPDFICWSVRPDSGIEAAECQTLTASHAFGGKASMWEAMTPIWEAMTPVGPPPGG